MANQDDNNNQEIEKVEKVEDVEVETTKNTSDTDNKKQNNDDGYEKVCFICRRPESVAGKMIELPNHICVCNDCMQKSFDAMSNGVTVLINEKDGVRAMNAVHDTFGLAD